MERVSKARIWRPEPPDAIARSPWANLHEAALPAEEHRSSGGAVLRGVPYASPPGFRPLLLDLYLPAPSMRPCPVVMWIHGGAFLVGSRSELPDLLARGRLFERVPQVGIALAAIDYRLSGEARFPAQLHDVKAAIRWLRQRSAELGIDPKRIGVWGESAGGHLAAMAAVTGHVAALEGGLGATGQSSAVAAAVDWYGPTDFAAMDRDAPLDSAMSHDEPGSPESLLIGAPVQERPDLVEQANPCHWASRDAPPIQIQHGTRDRFVPYGQSERLVEALKAVGADVTFLPVEGADHVFNGAQDDAAILDAAIGFLIDRLRSSTS